MTTATDLWQFWIICWKTFVNFHDFYSLNLKIILSGGLGFERSHCKISRLRSRLTKNVKIDIKRQDRDMMSHAWNISFICDHVYNFANLISLNAFWNISLKITLGSIEPSCCPTLITVLWRRNNNWHRTKFTKRFLFKQPHINWNDVSLLLRALYMYFHYCCTNFWNRIDNCGHNIWKVWFYNLQGRWELFKSFRKVIYHKPIFIHATWDMFWLHLVADTMCVLNATCQNLGNHVPGIWITSKNLQHVALNSLWWPRYNVCRVKKRLV